MRRGKPEILLSKRREFRNCLISFNRYTGVGEVLPFKNNSFDALISLAVLEHVKDPWRCVSEILRELKPGGEIICCVSFLQPFHGYPHYYYNMTAQGLKNIFDE